MRRFFLPDAPYAAGRFTIDGPLYRHLVKVLRLGSGAEIVLADGRGQEHTCLLIAVDEARLTVEVTGSRPAPPAPGPEILLCQGLPKGDRLELVLQKGTELGVSAFLPVVTSRSVARPPAERLPGRLQRWQRITAEAARQSGQPLVPTVAEPVDLASALAQVSAELKLVLWEDEQSVRLRQVLEESPTPCQAALLIGPEGGLTAAEVAMAREHGFRSVSLGKPVLRTETAGLAGVAILQYHWGMLG